MTYVTGLGTGACVAAALTALTVDAAVSMEKYSPMLPGVSTGVPAGALPPDGLYFNLITNPQWGSLKDGSGNNANIPAPGVGQPKVNAFGVTPQFLWVPGWEMFGAKYGAMITQPFTHQTTSYSGGNPDVTDNAMFNTIVTPLMLSWNFHNGWFFGAGMSFYLKDAHFYHSWNGTREAVNGETFANGYWTFEPNFAVSYLGNDWHLTLNNTFDFNTKNTVTGYQSGATYYLDMTAAKRFGPWQAGLIGNFVQQFENDKINGVVVPATPGVNSYGSKIQHVKIGPIVSYNFQNGMSLTARYLAAVHTENDIAVNQVWLSFSAPLYSGPSFGERKASKLITK
jgi:hypothetical protein